MTKRKPQKQSRGVSGKRSRTMSSVKSMEDLSAQRAIARLNRTSLPGSQQMAETTLVELKLYQVVSSTAGGVINYTVNANPGGYTDWSSYNSTYREYRILATSLTYEPISNNTYNATVQPGVLIHNVDRIDTTALASYGGAWNTASSDISNTGFKFSKTVKLIGLEDAVFSPTATPVTVWTHKMYADTLTASTVYGRVFLRALVQFRGRY